MKHIVIPEGATGKQLFSFLVENQKALISQKKALPKFTEAVSVMPEFFQIKDKAAIKTVIGQIADDADSVRAKIVANAARWCDSQGDVLMPDCWEKTIKDGNGRLHLKDHTYKLDARIGDVVNVYSQDVSLTELGLAKPGFTQCLIYESDVLKEYDQRIFRDYKNGKINQHSIGLNYVKIFLCVNDEDYKQEFAAWNKYIDMVINRDEVEEDGYFWAVTEIKLIECSAVLAGANSLTPTLEVKSSTGAEPPKGTQQQPHDQDFDWRAAIKQTHFFN